MSQELKAFYIAFLQWLSKSSYAKKHNPYNFSEVVGICENLNKYCESVDIPNHIQEKLILELHTSFKDAGLHTQFPFNNGSPASYHSEYNKYNNSDRFNWIKKHI